MKTLKILALFLFLASGLFAQNFPTSLDTTTVFPTHEERAATYLTASLTNVAGTATVASTAAFSSEPYIVLVGNEQILAVKATGTTFTLTRGFNGTTAAAHPNLSRVVSVWSGYGWNRSRSSLIAVETKLGTGSSTPGVSGNVFCATGAAASAWQTKTGCGFGTIVTQNASAVTLTTVAGGIGLLAQSPSTGSLSLKYGEFTDNSDLTLTFYANSSNRFIDLSGNLVVPSAATVSGTNTGDQFGSTTASRLLGRGSAAGAGAAQEITLGTNLSMSGTTINAAGGAAAVATDTIWDAKGDLAAGTGADAASRLAVGANDTFLVADSTQSTGIKWANAATSRTALGLGTMATQNANAIAVTGGTLSAVDIQTTTGGIGLLTHNGGGSGNFLNLKSNDNGASDVDLDFHLHGVSRTIDLSGNLTVSSAATISGTNTGDQTITLTGNVTGTGTGSFAATIANDAVTYAKMQNVSAADRLLGRKTAGAGDTEEVDCDVTCRNLLDDTSASAQRTTLGLGTLATQSGTFSGTSSGTNTGDVAAASTTDQLTGTDATKTATSDSVASLWEQGADVASSGTISLGEGGHFNITGTTGITDIDFATDKAGRRACLKFAGALILTHSSTLFLPNNAANITTAANDVLCIISEGSDIVRATSYQRATGQPLADTVNNSNWSGTALAIGNGGTGQTSQTNAFDALAPTTTQGDISFYDGTDNVRLAKNASASRYLANTGTTNNPAWDQVDMATGVKSQLAIGNGGTGQATAGAAFDALSPTTTQGDISFRNGTGNLRLAAGTSGQFLQTSGASANPVWADPPGGLCTNFKVASSDATTTGTTLTNITGLVSGTLALTSNYTFSAILYVTTTAVTTGTKYGTNVTVTPTRTAANYTGPTTVASNVQTGQVSGTNANAIASAAFLTTASEEGVVNISGFFTTAGSGTPVFSLQHLKVTSGTSTVKIGSQLTLCKQ